MRCQSLAVCTILTTVPHELTRTRFQPSQVSGSDDISPSWPVEQLAALLPGAQFVMVDGAEHYLHLTHPDELRACLRDFLITLSRQHDPPRNQD